MIAIVGLILAVGIAFYCHKLGEMTGFRKGVEYFENTFEQEIKKQLGGSENERK